MRQVELSSLQKFIVRNWGLVGQEQMAAFLGTEKRQVQQLWQSLGLPATKPLDPERAFPMILRVNWDLLPDAEIRRLTGLSEKDYRNRIQIMDMLDIKLGKQPDGLGRIDFRGGALNAESAAKFKSIASRWFSDCRSWDPPFHFLEDLSRKETPREFPTAQRNQSPFNLYMMYSYTATHGDFLLTGEECYSDGILSRLQHRGVNAGWMPVLLRDLAPGGIFTEFGRHHEIRIRNLRQQVQKALRYGVKLFLYLNEPRYLHASFFEKYPLARGMRAYQPGYYGMCTSDERVREWLFNSVRHVVSQIPELGGIVLITASESETNCYSHIPSYDSSADGLPTADGVNFGLKGGEAMCPRCQARGPEAVLSDTARLVSGAIRSASSKAITIQWLWSWNYIMPQASIEKAVRNLPPEVYIMVDWQRGTKFRLFGREAMIDEYTLAYTKPSPAAVKIMTICKELNRKVMAKCAVVSTVEMYTLPYMPVIGNVARLIGQLRKYKVEGLLGCWIFGAYPGRNMEMPGLGKGKAPARALAEKYYDRGAAEALQAWKAFSRGMNFFPSVQSVLYFGPLSAGPGLKFRLEPEPWRSGMALIPPEDIEAVSGPLGTEVLVRSLRKTADSFAQGLFHLKKAVGKSAVRYREENRRDWRICQAGWLHLLSAANYSEFMVLRKRLHEGPVKTGLKDRLLRILQDEGRNVRLMFALMKEDSRIGYEGSIGYFYTPVELMEKMVDLRQTIKQVRKIASPK